MFARAIDRVETFAEKHSLAVTMLGIAWFWLGLALQMHMIALPALPDLAPPILFWGGVAANAAWWGFLRPAIQQRRKVRAGSQP